MLKQVLNTEPHFESADDFYEALIHAHRELVPEQSHAMNAKMILLLANHIGSQSVLVQALCTARESTLSGHIDAHRP
jgi:hypothetical protein